MKEINPSQSKDLFFSQYIFQRANLFLVNMSAGQPVKYSFRIKTLNFGKRYLFTSILIILNNTLQQRGTVWWVWIQCTRKRKWIKNTNKVSEFNDNWAGKFYSENYPSHIIPAEHTGLWWGVSSSSRTYLFVFFRIFYSVWVMKRC